MMKTKCKADGFTLIEALFASILIGMVVVSLAAASGAFTMVNGVGIDMSTAEFLIEEIRALTAPMTFDELLTYNGNTYSPPIDISETAMAEFSAFSQVITIQYVQASSLDTVVTGPTDFLRVTVTVNKNGQPINSASWIRTNL